MREPGGALLAAARIESFSDAARDSFGGFGSADAMRNAFERQALMGETPVLLTSPGIRPYVRSIIERFRPMTVVMSQNEVHPKARLKTVGQV